MKIILKICYYLYLLLAENLKPCYYSCDIPGTMFCVKIRVIVCYHLPATLLVLCYNIVSNHHHHHHHHGLLQLLIHLIHLTEDHHSNYWTNISSCSCGSSPDAWPF